MPKRNSENKNQYNNESIPSNLVCIDNCEGYYELPNIFTPDGDLVNDLYHPLLPIKFVDSVEFKVYNRWGELVWSSVDANAGWDGSYANDATQLVQDGTYTWKIEFKALNTDERFIVLGHVNVIR